MIVVAVIVAVIVAVVVVAFYAAVAVAVVMGFVIVPLSFIVVTFLATSPPLLDQMQAHLATFHQDNQVTYRGHI